MRRAAQGSNPGTHPRPPLCAFLARVPALARLASFWNGGAFGVVLVLMVCVGGGAQSSLADTFLNPLRRGLPAVPALLCIAFVPSRMEKRVRVELSRLSWRAVQSASLPSDLLFLRLHLYVCIQRGTTHVPWICQGHKGKPWSVPTDSDLDGASSGFLTESMEGRRGNRKKGTKGERFAQPSPRRVMDGSTNKHGG